MNIRVANGHEAIYATLEALKAYGDSVSPRGLPTWEIVGFTLNVDDPTDMLCTGLPGFLPALAAAEALHLTCGEPYGETIRRITEPLGSERWKQGGPSFGERIRDQLPGIVELLRRDPDSRQAVATIWSEGDVTGGQADYLCGTSLQFLIRGGSLHLIVTMRSNDAWHGLPYNLFAFGQLQCSVARCLKVGVGRYVHNVGSMHLYTRHEGLVRDVSPKPEVVARPYMPNGVGLHHDPWAEVAAVAWRLIQDDLSFVTTRSEMWYRETLHGMHGRQEHA